MATTGSDFTFALPTPPHPPLLKSFGVILSGGLPRLGVRGFGGGAGAVSSGVLQAFVSDPLHGSNIAEELAATRGGFEDAGFAVDWLVVGDVRLKAEDMLGAGGAGTGDGCGGDVAGAAAGAGAGDAKSSKVSKRS